MFNQIFFLILFFCPNLKTYNFDDTSAIKNSTISLENKVSFESVNNDFSIFWKSFRIAVLASDSNMLLQSTKFPFETRGPLDSDPVIKYSKSKFIPVFKAFLNQWNGIDTSGATEIIDIKKTENPNEDAVKNDYARIGDMVFKKINKQWKFVFIYLNEETINILKNVIAANQVSKFEYPFIYILIFFAAF